MTDEVASRRSSVTIHIPSMSPSTTDLSFSDGLENPVNSRLPTLESESTRLQDSARQQEVFGDDVTSRPELVSETTECVLMTEKEIKEWDARMNEVVDRLKGQHQQCKEREGDLKKRRISAQDRLKNLKQYREKRFELYECVENYITGVSALIESRTDAEKSELAIS